MSKYQFCNNCEHIVVKMVNSVHDISGLNRLPKVEEWSCPARFNPYEAKSLNANKHSCPRNQKFMDIKRREIEAQIRHYRGSI